MSAKQLEAIWELCRQGFQITADDAAQCWKEGKRFEPKLDFPIARSLERLIDQCNWEVDRERRRDREPLS